MDLLVAADDRTGALETAAVLADHGAGPVRVRVWPETPGGGVGVLDLDTRGLPVVEARQRAATLPDSGPAAHKIDSTLRGNWADELVARHESTGRPVLVVPSLPELGRTCVGGVVLVHGDPVHDVVPGLGGGRRPDSSRPADLLARAGATEVVELAKLGDVARWLGRPSGVAVADAADTEAIRSIAAAWSQTPDAILAGTSAVIGCTATALGNGRAAPELPPISGAILVACGSVHPVAREQVAVAEHRGIAVTYIADDLATANLRSGDPVILLTELPIGDATEPVAVAAASALARGVADLFASARIGALVLIGGDTTAAVLGEAAMTVHGSIAPGAAWATVDGVAVPVVTRSGGFGPPHALVELVWETLR